MSDVLPGYIKIKEVARRYRTSRKTVERRRDKARDSGDSQTYRMFRLRTKDGEVHVEPSVEKVNRLTKEGSVPEWFVSRSWLASKFGERSKSKDRQPDDKGTTDAAVSSASDALAAVREQYEARISDLKDQLVAAERREERALKYAQEDKQLFAKASESLTRVLALPGITEALKAQLGDVVDGEAGEVIDGEDVKSRTPKPSASQSSTSQPTPKTRRSFWSRLTGGNHAKQEK